MSLGDQLFSVSSSKLHLLGILKVQVIEVKNKNALIKKQFSLFRGIDKGMH